MGVVHLARLSRDQDGVHLNGEGDDARKALGRLRVLRRRVLELEVR